MSEIMDGLPAGFNFTPETHTHAHAHTYNTVATRLANEENDETGDKH